jgi:uroporphyrinogen III methyltransferase/synthase
MEQRSIERLLVREAHRGRVVVRLKGGDPLIFGRGGEEIDALRRAGIPFEIVPGVTAASAAAAYAGIPLTDRRDTSAVVFLTGHPGRGRPPVRVESLPQDATLVLYMSVGALDRITQRLMRAGWPARRPAAIVERASLADQRVVVGTLGDIAVRARREGVRPPAIVMIGRVVRRRVEWRCTLPLAGRRVILTRPRSMNDPEEAFRALGAEVLRIPVIRTRPVRVRLPDPARYEWVAFTSATAVDRFLAGMDVRRLPRVAAVGAGTASALARYGIRADLVARDGTVSGLARALRRRSGRVLHPCADVRSPDLASALDGRLDEVVVYRIVPARPHPVRLGPRDIVTLASAETARRFAKWMDGTPAGVVAIGPRTAEAARAAGLRVLATARRPAFDAIVEAVCRAAR